jgi:malonyl-CoA/methylmalonyl-CoA synthetase
MNLLYDSIFSTADKKNIFIKYVEDTEPLTFERFFTEIKTTARRLQNLGLKCGDRLVLQIKKSHHVLVIYGACVQLGIIFIPLNTSYKYSEVKYFLSDSECNLFICESVMEEELKEYRGKQKFLVKTIKNNSEGSFFETTGQLTPLDFVERREAEDIGAILYTSGTTGRSKGAMLTHGNLISNAVTLSKAWKFTRDDVLLHALPIYHTHGLFVATNIALLSGCKMIFLKSFNIEQVIKTLPLSTVMMGVPTFYTRLLKEKTFNRIIVDKMRLFISGSAPLMSETHQEFEKVTGHKILERYGMTETNMITSNPYEGLRKAGTVGVALTEVNVRIVSLEKRDQILGQNEIGLIEVRGPNVFKGYWQMPEKTKDEFRDDGFFITGDIGFLDNNNYLSIVGRNKDLIITGGLNVYPKEIEILVDAMHEVEESAVIGVKHPDFGEGIIAIIVEKKDKTVKIDKMTENLRLNLAPFKVPKKIIKKKSLPRNSMGKVQKNLLRDEYKDFFKSDSI